MNEYRQSRDLDPFELKRNDLYALWDLLLSLLPTEEARFEWCSVSSNLGHVEITESTLDDFLSNPELPVTFTNLGVVVHKNYDPSEVRKTYSIRLSLRRGWATVSAEGPNEAWAVGAVEQVRAFFNSHRRRYGRLLRLVGASLPLLVGMACGMLGLAVASVLFGDSKAAILGLVSFVVLSLLAALVRWRKVGEVARIRLDEQSSTWSLGLTLTFVACVFTILTFVVALLQLLRS